MCSYPVFDWVWAGKERGEKGFGSGPREVAHQHTVHLLPGPVFSFIFPVS
jgi:hypothetical protein